RRRSPGRRAGPRCGLGGGRGRAGRERLAGGGAFGLRAPRTCGPVRGGGCAGRWRGCRRRRPERRLEGVGRRVVAAFRRRLGRRGRGHDGGYRVVHVMLPWSVVWTDPPE